LLRAYFQRNLSRLVSELIESGVLPEPVRGPVEVADTKTPEHGDFGLNFAMVAAKRAGMPPRELGEKLAAAIREDTTLGPICADVQVAGPGFINLFVWPEAVAEWVSRALSDPRRLSEPERPADSPALRINVEFVSVNPNGPITIGSGRGAAFGDTLCRVLAANGNRVHREYYINDGVNSEQMRLFAESVRAYVEGHEVPENGYRGEYVRDVAAMVAELDPRPQTAADYQRASQDLMIERQRADLALFGVEFDVWFSEQSLHDQGLVAQRIQTLIEAGIADSEPYRTKIVFGKNGTVEEVVREEQPEPEGEGEPTLWLRSTRFGDDMDRVLRRRDGRMTYIASDLAYHLDKMNRPPAADKLITVLGPDHHGYIGRLRAVLAALLRQPGEDAEAADRAALEEASRRLEVVIFQLVRFLKDGKPAPMRKRDGNIYELRDLIKEIGARAAPEEPEDAQAIIGRDVSRFFYLMRSPDTALDFDVDLATRQSDDNPVYYVQYAHARICQILRRAAEEGFGVAESPENDHRLIDPRETALLRKCLDLSWEVARAEEDYGVHRLATYSVELARSFHGFYDACRVVQPAHPDLTQARLRLCELARLTLQASLGLLGISAPERMDRVARDLG
jgi:arginyl-tRNA synthetase